MTQPDRLRQLAERISKARAFDGPEIAAALRSYAAILEAPGKVSAKRSMELIANVYTSVERMEKLMANWKRETPDDPLADRQAVELAADRDAVTLISEALASRARIAELEAACAAVLTSRDSLCYVRESKVTTTGPLREYWSPSSSMVASEAIAGLRAALKGADRANIQEASR